MNMQVRRFRLPVDQIAYARMIVDGYDGLAVVTTPAGSGSGVIEWWIAPGREKEADVLASALREECHLQDVDGDATTHDDLSLL